MYNNYVENKHCIPKRYTHSFKESISRELIVRLGKLVQLAYFKKLRILVV